MGGGDPHRVKPAYILCGCMFFLLLRFASRCSHRPVRRQRRWNVPETTRIRRSSWQTRDLGHGENFWFGSSMLLSKSAAQQRGASAAVDVGLCALRLRSLHLFYCSSNCCRIRSFITNARSYSCRLVVRCHAFAVSPCQPQGGCIYQQMPLFVSAAASLQAGTVAQDNLGPESSSSTTSTPGG